MDLHLTFTSGSLSGDGNDDLGRFLIKGRYDAVSRECYWTKSYVGAHDVFYRGFREGKGIWGAWEINIFGHGGFHIWPRHAGEGETQSESVSQLEPVDAIATEAIAAPADATMFRDGGWASPSPARPFLIRATMIKLPGQPQTALASCLRWSLQLCSAPLSSKCGQ